VKIAIVDYGMGNLGSVSNALTMLGAEPYVARRPIDLDGAEAIILPGVGAFVDGMTQLHGRRWTGALEWVVIAEGLPFLGICLGMQLLAEVGTEHGEVPGLGWIPGRVTRLPAGGPEIRVPHVGWNEVEVVHHEGLYAGFGQPPDFYFVHSYRFEPADDADVSGWCEHGVRFAASLERGPIWATQFHPEKSQGPGLAVLRNFLLRVRKAVPC